MAGQIKRMIDEIIDQKAKGDHALEYLMQAKLALKGVNSKKYDERSDDDPVILDRLRLVAKDFGVTINS
jgi:hypothetical protein